MNLIKNSKLLIVLLSVLLCVGCTSPWQGVGSLYVAEKGVIKCYNVDSVKFVGSRYTTYKIDGKGYSTESALDYYAGQKCE